MNGAGDQASEPRQPEAAARFPPVSLPSLFWHFLKIGSTAFGGFMSLISVVQQDVVEKRRLLTHEEMLDGISLATLLPGPVAVNVVAYVGHRLRGAAGAATSMVAVILPSFVMVVGLSAFYFRFGEIPAVSHAFAGFLPAVTAIIVAALWGLGKKTLKSPTELVLALAAATLLLGIGGLYMTLGVIMIAGLTGLLAFGDQASAAPRGAPPPLPTRRLILTATVLGGLVLLFVADPPWLAPASGARILVTFSGISLLLFGSGFVFIPLIQEIVVDHQQWLTQADFAAGIALGQITPGPILLSAAFIGYKVQGLWGAFLATLAIFTPSAVLMVTAAGMMERVRSSQRVQAALRGIRAAVIGLILAAAAVIGMTVPPHWLSLVIFAAALLALLRFKVDAIWVIPAAGLAGLLFY